MKALSIRQPWAWVILNAGKRIENRSRVDGRMPAMCSHRGPLLIHASAGIGRVRDFDDAIEVMRSRVELSRLRSGVCVRRVSVWAPDPDLARGGIVGVCNVVAHIDPAGVVHGNASGPVDRRWHVAGSYGLVLADVRPLPFMPYKGALGLFDVPGATPDLVVEIARREGRLP